MVRFRRSCEQALRIVLAHFFGLRGRAADHLSRAGVARAQNSFHHLEHMQRQFARCPWRARFADRASQVRQAQHPVIRAVRRAHGPVRRAVEQSGGIEFVPSVAATGKLDWTCGTGSEIYDSSFAWGGGNVFIGCVNGVFSAIDAKAGKLEWQYRLGPGHVLDSPATDDKSVYISSMSGKVTALPLHAR